jgi:hypothetical protein
MLGYCEVYLRSFQAEENVPGVAWSEHEDEVLADIRAARKEFKADVVIPFMHWGEENEPPSDREKTFARKMVDAGADVIVGAHPHVTQGAEYYKENLIVYSLGNFLFNGFKKIDNRTGWALRLTVNKRGMVSWNTVVLRLDEHGVPYPDFDAKSLSGHSGSKSIGIKSSAEGKSGQRETVEAQQLNSENAFLSLHLFDAFSVSVQPLFILHLSSAYNSSPGQWISLLSD